MSDEAPQSAVLENPVINEAVVDIRKLAMEADAAPHDEPVEQVEAPNEEKPEEVAPEPEKKEGEETQEQKDERARNEKGQFTKKDGEKAPEGEQKQGEQQPEKQISEFEKKRRQIEKDEQRIARNRREFEEEKQRERQRFQQEREEFERQRSQPPPEQYTTKQYEDAMVDFLGTARRKFNEGDVEQALGNLDLAEKAFKALPALRQQEQQRQAQQHQQNLQKAQNEDIQKTTAEFPELNDTSTPLAKTVLELIDMDPVFKLHPRGLSHARQIAAWKLGNERAEAADARAAALEKENAELRRKLTPLGGQPSERTGPVPFDRMSPDQQLSTIKRLAAESDAMTYRAA